MTDVKRWNCHDCGCCEGEIHEFGCDMERCPFCGWQLISCQCCYKRLGLYDKKRYGMDTWHIPPDVFEHGLTAAQTTQWLTILEGKGRIPYIQYPVLCSYCGTAWPEFFSVPTDEWEHYIQPDMRDTVICHPCYDHIKQVIDHSESSR